ncbi:hypothetical protein BBAD15_g12550 [Beauveria bassiana D1-5]|uniref:Uncharacterized protein n=1 Tax=Beauveria bassiana D1-5 TaxID=1245745 RepID=A0A0A2V7F9_BEABA|nr:hypothetical protein BBAD15_g12550 [Beauveria bassiana D1-5]
MKRYARAAGLAVVMMVAGVASASAAAKPSFDCARAKSGAEKAICGDPKLAALDVSIAQRFDKARRAYDADTAKIFSTEQWLFNGVRDQSYERPFSNPTGAAELAERLADRDKFLASLELAPRKGFEGQWGNYGGQLKVMRQADGSLFAEVSAADPYNARWLCDTSGKAEVRGDTLVIHEKDAPGWTLALRRKGMGLVAEEARPPGDKRDDPTPSCGSGGSMDGTYFPVR